MIAHISERALILAPHGRDANIASGILAEGRLLAQVCSSLDALMRELQRGAGLGLVTEESLRSQNLQPLAAWLHNQAEWSDFPFILLTQKGGGIERNPAAKRFLDVLGNVTFLERPFHPTTLISLVRAALRGRRRQYEARSRLEELRCLNETLEARVIARTTELAQAQDALRQSQKLEAIGQLTGGVAHDFNNLLMAIMSSVTLLRRRVPNDPALHRLIDNALQATHRGAALTQRMLAFARRQDLTPERLDVTGVVHGIAELVQRTLGPSWPLQVQFPISLPPVLADQNQLELALVNLALNARDAMPDGGTIRIAAEQRHLPDGEVPGVDPGWYVGVALIDTGHGMDAATLLRATEPFFTTKGVGKGTGLGLSMIYGMAKQLGGTITLRSAPGQGTTATLWLPAAREPQTEGPRPVSETKAAAAPVHNLKILAVDDDGLVLMNTSALLEDLGHDVIEAASGAEAIAKLEARPDIDLLITDQAMPNMTGIQLIRSVFETRPNFPVILATGYNEAPREFEGKIVKIGKPFTQRDLADALAQAFGKRDAAV